MTAAEILRNAQPPADDALIEKAIAELDNKIWEWTDALKSAHAQLRSAFAVRPPTPRPSTALYDDAPLVTPNLQAAAAAAHISAPPPMPAEWTAPVAPPPMPAEWAAPPPPAQQWSPSHGGHGAANNGPGSSQPQAPAANWAQPSGPGSQGFQPADNSASSSGVMQWPSATANPWPDSSTSTPSAGPQSWPTWTPTDLSGGSSGGGQEKRSTQSPSSRPPKVKVPKPVLQGPSAEERAQKAAAEETLLSELEDAIARRVRLLRRLDPDTAIEKLIEKAKLGHAEAMAAAPAKDDKSSSSWWRRK